MRRSLILLALTAAASGCFGGKKQFAETAPSPAVELNGVIAQASLEETAGRFSAADKLLSDYVVQHPSTGEAAEATFWRALFHLDPANNSGTVKEAAQLLDSYLSNPGAPRIVEAMTLRRVAALVEKAAASPVPVKTVEVVSPESKAKDEEIVRLKDELSKANAELERIKRRLTKP